MSVISAEVLPVEFRGFPKIPRLNREMIITEKIDGTNAAVVVAEDGRVYAQSRRRLITPEQDNHGFAGWVYENADNLALGLGPGYHYGEWWGKGINRGYDLDEKRFSLFNVTRWADAELPAGVYTVPELYRGNFSTIVPQILLNDLEVNGSQAAPSFMQPEGVIIYHTAANQLFKATLEGDESPKGK